MRQPERMTAEEIVRELGEAEALLGDRLLRIRRLAQSLYQRARRSPSTDNTATYIRFANFWARYGAAADQGLRRTARTAKGTARLLHPLMETGGTVDKEPDEKKRPAEAEDESPAQKLLDMYKPTTA